MDKMVVITSEESVEIVRKQLLEGLKNGKRQIAKITDKRSLDANAQVWVWTPIIADFMGWTVPEAAKELKLDFGLPILLSDPDAGKKTKFILRKCGFYTADRSFQLNMIDYLPVTRLFSTTQHNAYRDAIQIHFAKNGLVLEYEDKK
jgi:hypothetical protein